ncbi:MAG TPA: hypothetical protein VI461_09250, partial [Chitinophagaceae bacterium]|nr:hypothetical protein [Chitinophagaceae bacterium]
IVLCVTVISFLSFSRKWSIKISFFRYAVMLSILAGVYFLVTNQVKENGWNAAYYSTFIKYYDRDYEFHSSFSFSQYIALFWQRAIMAIVNTHFSFYLLLVLLLLRKYVRGRLIQMPFESVFCLMLVFVVFGRFILFPDFEDRFYTAYYLVTLIIFLQQSMTGNLSSKKGPVAYTV